ncbi:beta and beta-prime subunits of DNA dependent RNA-polymerase [Neocallimastix sp. 'constans']
MHLKFELYDNKDLENNSVLISEIPELVDNTTAYTLEPQLPCKQCKKIMECPGHLGRIPLYHRIVHPLFASTLCKETTHICPVCNKYNKSNNTKSVCCKNVANSSEIKIRSKKKNDKKTYSEYGFSFGNQKLTIDEMYELICSSDFTDGPSMQEKMKKAFIKNIPVLPINMRPSIKYSSNITIHNILTNLYIRLLDLNYQYRNENFYIMQSAYVLRAFNLFRKILGIHGITDKAEDSEKIYIKQMLSGKTGIFRSMCLAKRQNFCLRSVIVSNIDTPLNMVLIPKEFTDQLIPFGYKPYDYVIINRQPTLQATSLLAVRSCPSNCRTIQINPLIASVFQADFDGDEMNIFWLPGDEAKKELKEKLNIANNFRSFKNAAIMIKFIQDTLTGIYNMTRDYDIADADMIKKSIIKLFISQKEKDFDLKEGEGSLNDHSLVTHKYQVEIPYAHLISLLLPRNLTISYENKVLVLEGILLGVINGDNQSVLLNDIYNYGNNFYLKFMWDFQGMVLEYNLLHLISFSIADCIPSKKIKDSVEVFFKDLKNEAYTIRNADIDSIIVNNLQNNNLTNIVNSGSKGYIDNIIQILMSVGIATLLPNCYIENSYYNGLWSKELFIHSKSGRHGIISTPLSTSSTGYLQRELVKSMEDLVSDTEGVIRDYRGKEIFYYPFATNTPEIDDTFLEYAFTNACKKKN